MDNLYVKLWNFFKISVKVCLKIHNGFRCLTNSLEFSCSLIMLLHCPLFYRLTNHFESDKGDKTITYEVLFKRSQ